MARLEQRAAVAVDRARAVECVEKRVTQRATRAGSVRALIGVTHVTGSSLQRRDVFVRQLEVHRERRDDPLLLLHGRDRRIQFRGLAQQRARALARAQQQMCLLLREAMAVGKIALGKTLFSHSMTALEARNRIKDELSSYCVVTEAPKTTFGKVPARKLTRPHAQATDARSPHGAGADHVHGQAVRQAGRPLHRHPAGAHRPAILLPVGQVPQLPHARLPHAQRAAVTVRVSVCVCERK